MAVRVLSIDIMSYLKGQGFQAVNNQIGHLKKSLSSLKSLANNDLVKMAAGYFTINTLIGQYHKAVQASNVQIEHETKLYSTLKAQNYREEQIDSLKKYASELQSLGVIGDEASLAGIRQMASFKLQEDSIKQLLPSVHNLMVAEKGLNSTVGDAEKWSKSLGIAVSSGQVRALKQAGIVLDEHTAKMFENANEQQRVAILSKELKERIGEQNAEILKTPEGKIVSAQNRIGDVYEYIGGLVREQRAEFWTMVADNAEWIQTFLGGIVKTGAGIANTITRTIGGIFNVFKSMPPEARNTIKLLMGFLLLKKFPIAGAFLVIEDIFAAFQGKESFTEDAINSLFAFFNYDYKFEDLRQDLSDFWHDMTNDSDNAKEKISGLTATLETLFEILRSGMGLLEMGFGFLRTSWDTGKLIGNLAGEFIGSTVHGTESNYEQYFDEFNNGGVKNIKHGWGLVTTAGENTVKIWERYNPNYRKKEAIIEHKEAQIPKSIMTIPQNDRRVQEVQASFFKNQDEIKKYSGSRLPEKNIIKEAKETNQKALKIQKEEKNINFEYVNKASYTIKVENTNDRALENKISSILKIHDEENMQKMKTMVGGNFSLAGGRL